ncbi:MAG TPA: putative glycoside hydrolase [Rhodopila sp.]
MIIRFFATALLMLLAGAPLCYAQQGRVVDTMTGIGVAGATVTLSGRVVRADPDGRFGIDRTAAQVQARAPGYRAVSMTAAEFARAGDTLRLAPFRPKALYLSFYGIGSEPIRQAALHLIHEADLNAVVIDVKGDRGLIAYHSDLTLAHAAGAQRIITIPDMPALLRSLHQAGIYAIARIVTFKDDPVTRLRPDLAVKLQDGQIFRDREGLGWTDPTLREVADYNIGIAREAAQAGFDEIQFDYLRFPDAPKGVAFATPTTQSSRLEAITGFLAEARRQLAPFNVFLSADIFGYACWNLNDTGIGQRLEEMMPLVDYLAPMLYPSGFQFGVPGYPDPVTHPYEIVRLSLERARARLGVAAVRFRPWLQAFKDYAFDRRTFDAEEVTAQIRAAADFGSDGWMLWNPRNAYDGIGLSEENLPAAESLLACS